MPTQFKRVGEDAPLLVGHHIPFLGSWTKDGGFVKGESLQYDGESLACPVIGVVETKFGNKNVTLTVKGKISEYTTTHSREQGDYTIKTKVYEPTESTRSCNLTIPRHTRPWATFLLVGLGRDIYEIDSITDNIDYDTGKIEFYALASNGSKIIYWLGMHYLATQLRRILRPWVAPSKCTRCNGTGIEPGTTSTDCKQCDGYKYSGYNSEAYVQKQLGLDVSITRELIPNWDEMSDTDHATINKFMNKAWTQKWWVTPTENEILRLFTHFYNISEDDIWLEKRYNPQEPVWKIFLPQEADVNSPFTRLTDLDRELMKYIARSVTPAGVSVFMGFFKDFGYFDEGILDDEVILPINDLESSLEPRYELWGMPRWDFYNGWTRATVDFEDEVFPLPFSGSVDIFNANDMNRHVCRFIDNSYITTGMVCGTGFFDLWTHPQDSQMKYGLLNGSGDWNFYVTYNTDGFYDHRGNLLTLATKYSDYHLSVDFEKIQEAGYYHGSPHSFNNEEIGTTGTDISFIDIASVYDGELIIVSDWQNHKNVLRLQDDATPEEDPYFYHFFTAATSGIHEFYVGSSDITADWQFGIIESGPLYIVVLRINNSKLQYLDNGFAWQDIQAVANDTFYHIKMVWKATNKFDIWVDGTLKVDDISTVQNQVSGASVFVSIGYGDSTEYLYFDAWGDTDDSDYNLGDNLLLDSVYDYNVYVMKNLVGSISTDYMLTKINNTFCIENIGAGTGFVDAIGLSTDSAYGRYYNWQRLYPYGFGLNHSDSISGITNLLEEYFYRDRPIII